MPSVDMGLMQFNIHDVTPSEGSVWFHPNYPIRIPVVITPQTNIIEGGEIVTTYIAGRFISAGKIRADLADIVVTYFDSKFWHTVPSESVYTVDDGSTITVNFQALTDIFETTTYYIYFGNSKLVDVPETDSYAGEEYHNRIGLHAPYVSFTNPSQDWEVEPDFIVGSKPGAKFFSEIAVERFKLIGRRGPDAGTIEIRIDNLLIEEVDLFSELEELGAEIFTYELPVPGFTQIRVDISKERNVSSSGRVVRLDNILYDSYAVIINEPEEINPALDWTSSTGAKS